MKKFITFFAFVSLLICGTSCSKKTTVVTSSAAYANFETSCLGVEHDGSQKLRAWGKGVTKADAIEQAKKNAVYDVLFKGIKGTGECNQNPLVLEVNARERYAKYFNPFFSDGGEYKHYVKAESGNSATILESKGSSINNYGVIVTVDREKLRDQLVKDGVLKPGTTN